MGDDVCLILAGNRERSAGCARSVSRARVVLLCPASLSAIRRSRPDRAGVPRDRRDRLHPRGRRGRLRVDIGRMGHGHRAAVAAVPRRHGPARHRDLRTASDREPVSEPAGTVPLARCTALRRARQPRLLRYPAMRGSRAVPQSLDAFGRRPCYRNDHGDAAAGRGSAAQPAGPPRGCSSPAPRYFTARP